MANKTRVIFMVGSTAEPENEKAFNEWYNKTHIPEVTSIPGVKFADRYEILEPEEGYPKYIAVYEMDGEEGYKNFLEHSRRQRAGEVPRFTPGPPVKIVWRKAFRRIGP